MIKAVVFDLDNTLIDFMGTKMASCEAAIDAMIKAGLKTSKRRARNVLFSLYRKKGIENQRVFQPLLEKITGKVDYKVMAAGIVAYRKTKNFTLKTYPNVGDVLEKLGRAYKLAILSDAPALQAWTRLFEMGLEGYFDVVIAYEDTRRMKPHQRPFAEVLKRLKVKPSEAVMVGDNVARDVKGAKLAGMKTVLASYGNTNYEKSRAKPDAIIRSITELPGVLRDF